MSSFLQCCNATARPTLFPFIEKENLADRDAAGKSRLVGFKFLRLEKDPLAELRKLDGPAAPKVVFPTGQ